MTEIFKMPDIGEGMAEGEIANWLVKVGDTIKEEDAVAEVQNDKLLQEILSPYGGKITKLFVEAGTVVKVGEPLIEFDGDGSGAGAESEAPKETPASTEPEPESSAPVNQTAPEVTKVGAEYTSNGQLLAMPSVREYARKNDIDLTQVPATGRHGHITMADVENFKASPASAPTASPALAASVPETESEKAPSAPVTPAAPAEVKAGRVPLSPVRKVIAKTLTNQVQTIPHVTIMDEVEVSKLMDLRNQFKEQAKQKGYKLTYMPFIAKALAGAAHKYPELSAMVDIGKQEIVYYEDTNVSFAVDTDNGLFVPNVKNVKSKSIMEVAQEIDDMAIRGRAGDLKPNELKGGTVTITNIGSESGSGFFTPIINPGESAILGIGRIRKTPVVNEDGELAVGNTLKLSLSFDHRLIDGALAQKIMNELKALLSNPAYMLMEV
ncbi:dihydrolipoamide acetyltransferase family protein [Pediococcus pentosaceus]|uniref:dihydrolipoamide acetyltransferase family protein n=1 Tax=Pediococcus pentosaceus TaxID=1255 RepID=UPI001E290E40|nr:dihydrolipoamide acetyltransferase family protein [Pediococcus pentosaceus]MCD5257173.1 2-oxo acid dehydrogenase subunit E2 [Pediococcus pentosaceus]